ncbi:MAG: DUF4494 domain-containing protein [Prevotellaceae bacterium]|jgi:hypothetical protein|nr:DUF4494 domain-containing protein [Prevotellaceae bacterium]
MNWFECGVSYQSLGGETGLKTEKKVFLVDAISFAEAENIVSEYNIPFNSGEFKVEKIRVAKIAEIIDNGTGDRWYKGKITFLSVVVDEKKGKEVEKKVSLFYLVKAEKLQDAVENLIEFHKTTQSDYTIVSVTETLIEEVLKYQAKPQDTSNQTQDTSN